MSETLSHDAAGRILRIVGSDSEAAMYQGDPAGLAGTLVFDRATNAALSTAIRANPDAYRVIGGALQLNGSPVAIAADSEDEAVRKVAQQTVNDLTTYLGLASPTNAQNILALKTLARAVRYLIRREFGVS